MRIAKSSSSRSAYNQDLFSLVMRSNPSVHHWQDEPQQAREEDATAATSDCESYEECSLSGNLSPSKPLMRRDVSRGFGLDIDLGIFDQGVGVDTRDDHNNNSNSNNDDDDDTRHDEPCPSLLLDTYCKPEREPEPDPHTDNDLIHNDISCDVVLRDVALDCQRLDGNEDDNDNTKDDDNDDDDEGSFVGGGGLHPLGQAAQLPVCADGGCVDHSVIEFDGECFGDSDHRRALTMHLLRSDGEDEKMGANAGFYSWSGCHMDIEFAAVDIIDGDSGDPYAIHHELTTFGLFWDDIEENWSSAVDSTGCDGEGSVEVDLERGQQKERSSSVDSLLLLSLYSSTWPRRKCAKRRTRTPRARRSGSQVQDDSVDVDIGTNIDILDHMAKVVASGQSIGTADEIGDVGLSADDWDVCAEILSDAVPDSGLITASSTVSSVSSGSSGSSASSDVVRDALSYLEESIEHFHHTIGASGASDRAFRLTLLCGKRRHDMLFESVHLVTAVEGRE